MTRKRLLFSIIGLILILAIGASVYFFFQYQKTQTLLKNPNAATEEEIKKLADFLGKFVDLPTGEKPTLATITDKNVLRNEPFFAQAENGDKVLIYPTSKKAILYRPSTSKVIEIATVNLGSAQPTVASAQTSTNPTPTPTPTKETAQPFKVAIYNSTATSGLAKNLEAKIKEKYPQAQTTTGDAPNTISKTTIVDNKGGKKEIADTIAQVSGGEVGPLPEGEPKPDVDIIVIIGSNYNKQ